MELMIIRHAPSVPAGHLYGRTNVAAEVSDDARLAALRCAIGRADRWFSSPALRCHQTHAALDASGDLPTFDERLWEQDFGAWEGLSYSEVPDIGALDSAALVDYRSPGGESFSDVCQRVQPALQEIVAQGGNDCRRIAMVAHAGVVRAALALALGAPALALSFDVRPLSLTKFRIVAPDAISIVCSNWCPQCA